MKAELADAGALEVDICEVGERAWTSVPYPARSTVPRSRAGENKVVVTIWPLRHNPPVWATFQVCSAFHWLARGGVRMKKRVLILTAMAMLAVGAQAQGVVTERDDGTVVLSTDTGQFVLPADIADRVTAAIAEHKDDPDALRAAIRAIVVEHAGGSDDTELVTAIAVFAIFHARADSSSVNAVIRGATDGNRQLAVGTVLTALPGLERSPRAQAAAEQQVAQSQATIENPAQVSPVE